MKRPVPPRRGTSPAVLDLKARIARGKRRCLGAADVQWFLETHEPNCMPLTVLEGPPCMIIVVSTRPVSRAARALFERIAPTGMNLYFVKGKC